MKSSPIEHETLLIHLYAEGVKKNLKNKIAANLPCVLSYGALLILCTLPDFPYPLISALLFLAGSAYIFLKVPVQGSIPPEKKRTLLVVTAFISFSFGMLYYMRWLMLSDLLIKYVTHVKAFLLVSGSLLSLLSSVFIYRAAGHISNKSEKLTQNNRVLYYLLLNLFMSVITVLLSQAMVNALSLEMGIFKLCMNILIVFSVLTFLYGVTGCIRISLVVWTGTLMLLSTANGYVNLFRYRMLEPTDVFSASTAMNVLGNYSLFPVPRFIVFSWIIYIGYIFIICFHIRKKTVLTVKKRAALLSFCLIGALSVYFYSSNIKLYHWWNEGARFNGYFLNFVSIMRIINIQKPDHYSKEYIAELSDQYASHTEERTQDQTPPHIIVIMDEAFSDLNAIGKISTDTEVAPFISSLRENSVSGYTLVSVFGGNTANSEYEFLTGNSMAWLPLNSVPYQQYINRPVYSAVSYLKSRYGYRCTAFHPLLPDNWNRASAFQYMGFDQSLFLESFPQKDLIRGFVSDREMFGKITETFEQQHDSPLFYFGITMQNHGGYDYSGDDWNKSVSLVGCQQSYPQAEQYLSLIHETDKAVEYLIHYFSSVEDKVVIVFFGDHQPRLEDEFYHEISGAASGSLDEMEQKFKVPFFIWANYDIEKKNVECTSLNYLSSYMYKAAGLELPAYNRFLSEMESVIPSINGYGFYSAESQCYVEFDMASAKEKKWLEKYRILQYNNAFDKKNIDKKMFPLLNQGDQ